MLSHTVLELQIIPDVVDESGTFFPHCVPIKCHIILFLIVSVSANPAQLMSHRSPTAG